MAGVIGQVRVLRRFPVKSMQGEHVGAALVTPLGVLGDRAWALVDSETREVVTGKTPELGPRLLASRASFVTEPQPDAPLPAVVIELPDGRRVRTDEGDADAVLAASFGRPVRLVTAAPPDSALVANRTDFVAAAGLPDEVGPRSLLDALPVSVVTTATLDQLGAARPATSFDERRFRMNVVVATASSGFAENAWPGHVLALGDVVLLQVAMPTPRCVLTTMAVEELPRDPAVLRTVAQHNSVPVAGRRLPCVGAYCSVQNAGEIRIDDAVRLV
jgi:uncharacterized protein YcbX